MLKRIGLLMVLLLGAAAAWADNVWQHIKPDALIVDVRSEAEFQQGHLPNAVLIPHDQLAQRISELGANKERQIVLYCRSGRRSGLALDIVTQHGFTQAINAGGYQALVEAQAEHRASVAK